MKIRIIWGEIDVVAELMDLTVQDCMRGRVGTGFFHVTSVL